MIVFQLYYKVYSQEWPDFSTFGGYLGEGKMANGNCVFPLISGSRKLVFGLLGLLSPK